jgi:C4-dicarboxylate-specific signal transduction histidine kinase
LKRHKVNVVCDFEEIPEAPFEKHKVLQILVNLISNAKYALDEGEPPEKRLSLTLARPEPAQVVFHVADNGIGFNEEVATKLFRHGFTTRKEGHGFGLHSSVLAAKEMGGSLEARSQGLGRGAAFILTLPIRSLISQSLEPQVSSE